MPVQVFTAINDLVAYVQAELPTNGNQEITAARHREVMQSTILSLVNILSSLPPELVLDYPAWDSEATYVGGDEVIVRHNGKLWLFVSGTGQTGVEPGNNFTVWSEVSAIQVAHLRNRDTHLDQGGVNQVTAAQLRQLLDRKPSWGEPFVGFVDEPDGGEVEGTVYIVSESATGLFAGQEGNVAKLVGSSWQFEVPGPWEYRAMLDTYIIAFNIGFGSWVPLDLQLLEGGIPVPALASVLGSGNGTGANDIVLNRRIRRSEVVIAHGSGGDLNLNLALSSFFRLDFSSAGNIVYSNPDGRSDYYLYIRVLFAGVSIGWPNFSVSAGVVMPDDTVASYLVHIINLGILGSTQMHIKSCDVIEY